uniref:Uncharacterized protein n=1 Tax=Musa acuminata TaxID=4641 RepID=Q1ENY3_MUSAC|nr:hypothetical protein MA4_111B14.12 [Musa acuminata]
MQHGRYLVPYIHIIRITRCALLPRFAIPYRTGVSTWARYRYGMVYRSVHPGVPSGIFRRAEHCSSATVLQYYYSTGPVCTARTGQRSPEEEEAEKGAQQLTPPTSTPLPRERKRPREKIRERMVDESGGSSDGCQVVGKGMSVYVNGNNSDTSKRPYKLAGLVAEGMAAVAGMFGWVDMSEGTAAAAGEEGILPADTEQDRAPAGILLVDRLPEDKRKNLLLLGACMEKRTAVLDCTEEHSEHSLKAWQTWQEEDLKIQLHLHNEL